MPPNPFSGVLPAITTPFHEDLSVDHDFLARHARQLLAAGCAGLIPLGSLGESATLEEGEKMAILRTLVEAAGDRPVIAGIAALSTAGAVRLARAARDAGCAGLMVLPPYVYASDWREMRAHVKAVLDATDLPCMLYNNPVAYKTDFLPEHVLELAGAHENLLGVKESSADVRRVTALRAVLPGRVRVLVGVDDALVEGVLAGAEGWVAGLVSAFPEESVRLYDLARAGRVAEATELYRWFLPLLRLDTVIKFVQLIKFVQQEVGMGSAHVRPPRLELTDAEADEVRELVRAALAQRPTIPA